MVRVFICMLRMFGSTVSFCECPDSGVTPPRLPAANIRIEEGKPRDPQRHPDS